MGGGECSVADLMRLILSRKKLERSSAERADSTIAFVDDRPEISSMDCHNRRGFLDELILFTQNSCFFFPASLCWDFSDDVHRERSVGDNVFL